MSDNLIQVKNVHKTYKNDSFELPVLKGIDLAIRRFEIIALVGPSGAGKSTFLHLLGALDKPTAGQILFEEQDLFTWDDRRLAQFRNQTLGFIFQFHHLLPEFTALENVCMPLLISKLDRKEAEATGRRLLAEVGLEQRAHHRPGELSGGEQQRVAIARALATQPKLILADEPTGNLDRQTGEMVYNVLESLNRQKKITMVLVTHNEALAAKADRIVHLVDGKIKTN